jgi:hypothetical protein
MKAQILAKISATIKPLLANFPDYDITFYITEAGSLTGN